MMGVRRSVAGRVAAAAGVLILAAATLLVLRPLLLTFPATGLDESWTTVTGEAAAWPARWGVDLAFTYGPAVALTTHYYTDGYLASTLPVLAGLALLFASAFVLLARRAAEGRGRGAILVGAAVAAEVAALATRAGADQDSLCFVLAFALFLVDLLRRPGQRLAAATVLAGAALLGALALVKTSYGVAAFGLLALADARAFLLLRRPPTLLLLAVLGALAASLGHGQRLSDLPNYLDLQGQVAAGYGEAMYLAPDRVELALYLCGAAGLVAVAGLCGAPGRAGRLAAATGTAFLMAVGAKAGFVRADSHTQIAWSLLGLAGLSVAVGLVLPRTPAGAAALGGASLLALWLVGPLFLLPTEEPPAAAAGLPGVYREMRAGIAGEAEAWVRLLRDPSGFASAARAAKARAWAAVRAAYPLPALAGSVDMVPSEQSAVMAAGLDYRPRPSFQEYSTYAPGLIAANRAFYAGGRAPDWVIFAATSLDDRYPASAEGPLWPELLRRYEPERRLGRWLALHRRAAPLPDVLGPPSRVAARLGEPVALPADAGPTFARVLVRKTLLGRLAAALFRPPALSLNLALAGYPGRSYRFIPAVAEAGFVLSPVIDAADGFADLAFGRGQDVGGPAVTGFTVGGSRWARLFYDAAVAVELRPIQVPAVPPSAEAQALYDELARPLPWRRLVRAMGRAGQLDGDRLSAPAPTALAVPVAGMRRLNVTFGIVDDAWRQGATDGVCFAVTGRAEGQPLWRRCLDPKAVAADRGPQSATLDLPPGLDAVTAETSCRGSCAWDWAYWSGIGPEDATVSADATSRISPPRSP